MTWVTLEDAPHLARGTRIKCERPGGGGTTTRDEGTVIADYHHEGGGRDVKLSSGRVTLALGAACAHDAYCAPPFTILRGRR